MIMIEVDVKSGFTEIDAIRVDGILAPEVAQETKQWANKVISFSSEYSSTSWSANQVLGAATTFPLSTM